MNSASLGPLIHLRPVPWLWFRRILVAAAAIWTLGMSGTWPLKGLGIVLIALLAGSFVEVRVVDGVFRRDVFFCFLPVFSRRYDLSRCTAIETEWVERGGLGEALLLGLYAGLVSRLWDATFPWMGAPYKLWLRDVSGRRVLAWQGSNSRNFHANLESLRRGTGLPVRSA